MEDPAIEVLLHSTLEGLISSQSLRVVVAAKLGQPLLFLLVLLGQQVVSNSEPNEPSGGRDLHHGGVSPLVRSLTPGMSSLQHLQL